MHWKYLSGLLITIHCSIALQAQYPATQAVQQVKLSSIKMPTPAALPYSGIDISTAAIQDSTAIGFVTADEISQAARLVPDTNMHRWLQTCIKAQYAPLYTPTAPRLLCVLQDLRIQEQKDGNDGFLRLKAITYSTPVREEHYQLVNIIDTVITVSKTSGIPIIAQAIDLLLQPAASPQAGRKTFTRLAIAEPVNIHGRTPVMLAREYKTGAYLSYEDFLNNRPSVENITVKLDPLSRKFNVYELTKDSALAMVPACWGIAFENELYIYYQDMLVPIEKNNNSFMLSSWVTPDKRQNRARFWRWILEKAGPENNTLRNDIFDKVYRKGINVPGSAALATRLDPDNGLPGF
ncbi:hypothetical protein [Chitinophaga qingshengii]|uniref:Uncharacterized protein n=1 Tax=Chitinophaga qingshengii TaxID=1569794 RepID=A0ABR7TFC1_9BACT|nr:hypothetical protein [Chitinophaga qingshengii]MBC9928984.1 hypothetical protein [Chitinophaga qingshengii]